MILVKWMSHVATVTTLRLRRAYRYGPVKAVSRLNGRGIVDHRRYERPKYKGVLQLCGDSFRSGSRRGSLTYSRRVPESNGRSNGPTQTPANRATRRYRASAGVALGVLVAVAAILVRDKTPSTGSASPRTTSNSAALNSAVSDTTSGVSTSSSPTKTNVVDLNWIDATSGWALATRTGANGSDEVIFSTTNGGASWRSEVVQIPPTSFGHIRFANHQIGYIWGGAANAIYVSNDGGRTWNPQVAPWTIDLEPVGSSLLRLVANHGLPGPSSLQSLRQGSRAWKSVDIGSSTGEVGGRIIASGSTTYIAFPGDIASGVRGDLHTIFYRSADGFVTWQRFSDPCPTVGGLEQVASSYAAGPGLDFAVLCARLNGSLTPTSLRISSDGGSTFSPPITLPKLSPGVESIAMPAPETIDIAAFNTDGSSTVETSTDGGATWRVTLSTATGFVQGTVPIPWLGFQTSHTGRVAFGIGSGVWTTTDGGEHWTPTPLG